MTLFPARLAAVLFLLASCSQHVEKSAAPAPQAPPFWSNVEDQAWQAARSPLAADPASRWWLEKTVRLLRGGAGLRPGEKIDELLAMPREQAVDLLSRDARIADLALDFNIYFLGFKQDALRKKGQFNPGIYSFSSAIESARELLAGGDYLRLLDLEMPAYSPPGKAEREEGDKDLPETELFWKNANALQANLQAVIDYARKDPAATVPLVCDRFREHFQNGTRFILMGVPTGLVLTGLIGEKNWYFRALGNCFGGAPTTVEALAILLEDLHGMNARFFAQVFPLFDPAYKPATVADFKTVDLKYVGFSQPWMSWGITQRNTLVNSSTNSNRKRGAYVLKRFFCDDLTPIGVDNPNDHAGGAHGSDPSCVSCHYKLDPIAGYFRNFGSTFQDFSDRNFIFFDDQAVVPREQYTRQWRAQPGSGREWNVGYVRSLSDERRNDYGSSLDDLHSLLRRAPEVKRCLVKRMFEYAVGEEQTIDPGLIDELGGEFERKAAENSSSAFRWLVKKVVLSRTFVEPDPVPSECYDFPGGSSPALSPPCRVSYLLQKNCAGCHSSTDENGNLDLTKWVNGTFPHLGEGGVQQPMKATLEAIISRLGSTDTKLRMPKNKYMSPQDREALFLWAQETLSQLEKKGRK